MHLKTVVCVCILAYTIQIGISDSHVILSILKKLSPNHQVVEFTCNKKGSFLLSKTLSQLGIRNVVRSISEDSFNTLKLTHNLVFVTNLTCWNATQLQAVSSQGLFNFSYKWIITTHQGDDYNSCRYFKHMQIPIDSDVILINKKTQESSYELRRMYKNIYFNETVFEPLNYIETKTILSGNATISLPPIRRNLQNATLVAAIVITHNSTLQHLYDNRERRFDMISKLSLAMEVEMADFANASIKLSVQDNWGYPVKGQKLGGMFGELSRNEATLAGTAAYITRERLAFVDYLIMTYPATCKFVFLRPKLSYVKNVYVLPFHWSVWLAILFLILIAAAAIYVAAKWERMMNITPKEQEGLRNMQLEDTIPDVALLALSGLCQQGPTSSPYSNPGRVMTFLLYFSLMALYTAYAANILALLQSSSNYIRTPSDLLNSRLECGAEDIGYNRFFLSTASDPLRKTFYQKKLAPPNEKPRFFSMEEGIALVRKGLFAWHTEEGSGYRVIEDTFTEEEKCDLESLQYLQVPEPYISIAKNLPFREVLKINNRRIYEYGLRARHVGLIITKKPQCVTRGSSFVGVTMADCYFAAAIFGGGVLISVIFLIAEIYIRRTSIRKQVVSFQAKKTILQQENVVAGNCN